MRSTRRFGITAMTAAIALSLGAVPVALTAAVLPPTSGDTTPINPAAQAPVYTPSGALVLETGASNRVFLDSDGSGALTEGEPAQGLSGLSKNCLIVSDPSENLLIFDGKYQGQKRAGDDAASFAGNSIGVAEKTSGQSCSQVNAASTDVLTLKLNGGSTGKVKGPFGPLVASSAFLDVELKQSARILATAYITGKADPVGYFELQSGASRGTSLPLPGDVQADGIWTCTGSADSGPDSGVGDNCKWAISSPSWLITDDPNQAEDGLHFSEDDGIYFDTLVLKAVAGSFSIEGGADGPIPGPVPGVTITTNDQGEDNEPIAKAAPTTNASLFELVGIADGELFCGGSVTRAAGPDGTIPEVTVTRLNNVGESQEDCRLIPYTLSNGTSSARFLKPLDDQPNAQFVFDFEWTVPVRADTSETTTTSTGSTTTVWTPAPATLPATQVDFEAGRGPISIGWCPDPIISDGVLGGITNPTLAPDLDNTLTNTQYACVGSQSTEIVSVSGGLDKVKVYEQIYVLGDIRLLR